MSNAKYLKLAHHDDKKVKSESHEIYLKKHSKGGKKIIPIKVSELTYLYNLQQNKLELSISFIW